MTMSCSSPMEGVEGCDSESSLLCRLEGCSVESLPSLFIALRDADKADLAYVVLKWFLHKLSEENIKVTAEIEEAFVGVLTMTCVSSDVPVAFEDRELEELVSLTAGSARTTSLWIVKMLLNCGRADEPDPFRLLKLACTSLPIMLLPALLALVSNWSKLRPLFPFYSDQESLHVLEALTFISQRHPALVFNVLQSYVGTESLIERFFVLCCIINSICGLCPRSMLTLIDVELIRKASTSSWGPAFVLQLLRSSEALAAHVWPLLLSVASKPLITSIVHNTEVSATKSLARTIIGAASSPVQTRLLQLFKSLSPVLIDLLQTSLGEDEAPLISPQTSWPLYLLELLGAASRDSARAILCRLLLSATSKAQKNVLQQVASLFSEWYRSGNLVLEALTKTLDSMHFSSAQLCIAVDNILELHDNNHPAVWAALVKLVDHPDRDLQLHAIRVLDVLKLPRPMCDGVGHRHIEFALALLRVLQRLVSSDIENQLIELTTLLSLLISRLGNEMIDVFQVLVTTVLERLDATVADESASDRPARAPKRRLREEESLIDQLNKQTHAAHPRTVMRNPLKAAGTGATSLSYQGANVGRTPLQSALFRLLEQLVRSHSECISTESKLDFFQFLLRSSVLQRHIEPPSTALYKATLFNSACNPYDLEVLKAFDRNEMLLDLFEFLTDDMVQALKCKPILVSLLISLIRFWNSDRQSRSSTPNARRDYRLRLTRQLLRMLAKARLVPPPLQRCAELITHVSAADRTSLIFSIFEWMVRDEGEDDRERLDNITALLKNVIFENIEQLPAQFQYYVVPSSELSSV